MVNKTSNKSATSSEVKEEKKVNPTWAAALKYQPAFSYVAPEMFD